MMLKLVSSLALGNIKLPGDAKEQNLLSSPLGHKLA